MNAGISNDISREYWKKPEKNQMIAAVMPITPD
jgi:hypothetical protein